MYFCIYLFKYLLYQSDKSRFGRIIYVDLRLNIKYKQWILENWEKSKIKKKDNLGMWSSQHDIGWKEQNKKMNFSLNLISYIQKFTQNGS